MPELNHGEDQVWESGDDRRREQQPLEPSWLVQCWWLEWKLWWNRGHSDVLPSVIYDSNGPRILDRKNRSFRNYKEVKPVSVIVAGDFCRTNHVADVPKPPDSRHLQVLHATIYQTFPTFFSSWSIISQHVQGMMNPTDPNGVKFRRCILVSTHCGVLSPWIWGEQTHDRNTSPCIRCE